MSLERNAKLLSSLFQRGRELIQQGAAESRLDPATPGESSQSTYEEYQIYIRDQVYIVNYEKAFGWNYEQRELGTREQIGIVFTPQKEDGLIMIPPFMEQVKPQLPSFIVYRQSQTYTGSLEFNKRCVGRSSLWRKAMDRIFHPYEAQRLIVTDVVNIDPPADTVLRNLNKRLAENPLLITPYNPHQWQDNAIVHEYF